MATVIPAEDLSTEVVVNLFQTPIQAEADDPNAPLTDPAADDRSASDPAFVLPSLPDGTPVYPHVIVSEADYTSSSVDARSDVTEGDYDVIVRVLADSVSGLNQIVDGVRHWFVDQSDTLVDAGFTDPRIPDVDDVPPLDVGSGIVERQVVFRGTVYTE